MSISILALGKLASDPETRTSQNGKTFCKVRLSVSDGEQSILVSCVCFSESAIETLQRLGKGDSIAVTGRGKPTAWQKEGELRTGLDLMVDGVMTAYQVGKKRGKDDAATPPGKHHHGPGNPAAGDAGAYRAAAMAQRAGDDLGDDLPW